MSETMLKTMEKNNLMEKNRNENFLGCVIITTNSPSSTLALLKFLRAFLERCENRKQVQGREKSGNELSEG